MGTATGCKCFPESYRGVPAGGVAQQAGPCLSCIPVRLCMRTCLLARLHGQAASTDAWFGKIGQKPWQCGRHSHMLCNAFETPLSPERLVRASWADRDQEANSMLASWMHHHARGLRSGCLRLMEHP
eukprot:157776-Chlamydomonas_euryale.AAC.3